MIIHCPHTVKTFDNSSQDPVLHFLNTYTLQQGAAAFYADTALGRDFLTWEEKSYKFTPPAYRESLGELVELFAADMAEQNEVTFEHPAVCDAADHPDYAFSPLFSNAITPHFFDNPHGFLGNGLLNRYLAVLRNADEVPVAFVEFDISISRQLDHLQEEAAAVAEGVEHLVELGLAIKQFYVRKAFRRQGAGTAAIELIARHFSTEVAQLHAAACQISRRHNQDILIHLATSAVDNSLSMAWAAAWLQTCLAKLTDLDVKRPQE